MRRMHDEIDAIAQKRGPMGHLARLKNAGVCDRVAEGRRHQLILLADKYGIPIIEDDPYGQLRYEGEHIAPLVVLDRENVRRDNGFTLGNVIYLSTFSKTLAPGIRLAWIVAPEDVIIKLVQLKQAADLHTSTFNQYVAYEVARDGFLDQHVKLIRQVYRERRDTMLQALHEYFPPEVTWTHPKGGLFLWVTMPEGTDSEALLRAALAENVAFVAGDSFYPNNGHEGSRHMRLNFSHSQPEQIREGIRRLSVAVKMQLRAHAPH
jgi:2-aminoadipate transaminase